MLGFLFVVLVVPTVLIAQSNDLLSRVWAGVQQSQQKYATVCGSMSETRTSQLMAKPMVLHGKFCSQGTDHFMLEYAEPSPMRIRVNGDYMNITRDGKTEALGIRGDMQRAQSSFAHMSSLDDVRKSFDVTAQENAQAYELKFVPRSMSYRHRVNYFVVKLDKRDFLPRSFEIDGKSGVNSVFNFEVTSTNTKLPESTFEVSKPSDASK